MSVNAPAQRVHDRMRELGIGCTGTHLLGYATCQSLAAAALADASEGDCVFPFTNSPVDPVMAAVHTNETVLSVTNDPAVRVP